MESGCCSYCGEEIVYLYFYYAKQQRTIPVNLDSFDDGDSIFNSDKHVIHSCYGAKLDKIRKKK